MLQSLLLQIAIPVPANALRPYYLALENDLVGNTFFFSMFALFGGRFSFFWSGATCRGAGTPT